MNAFTADEVSDITGLTRHMIDYLARESYLAPAYATERTRGKVRFYSYRDLVVAQLIQRLCATGIELRRLKRAILHLSRDEVWLADPATDPRQQIKYLITDGTAVYLKNKDGFLTELGPKGQRAFGFVVNLPAAAKSVKRKIPKKKRQYYSLTKNELIFEKDVAV